MSSSYPQVNDFFLVAKSLKSHGTDGQLRLMIDQRLKVYMQPGSFIFFDLNGSKVPFRISKIEEGQHFVISLDEVVGKQTSDRMTNTEIWIPIGDVKPRHLKSPRNIKEKWEDYQLLDETSGTSYRIIRTEEYPQQLMAVIEVNGKEILIPLHEQLIVDIDKEQKVIRMEIPEGLLEL